ncbi:MAG: DUF4446 family protein [Bacteroidota bacterium]
MADILVWYKAFLQDHQTTVLSLVLLLTLLCGIFFAVSAARLRSLRHLYESALTHKELAALEEILLHQYESGRRMAVRIETLEEKIARLERSNLRHIQHCVLERYRAFKDVGGDQSFSLALLDSHGDGVVLTSIYGREESRIFAKPIKAGGSSHALSEEEKRVLSAAKEGSGGWQKEIKEIVSKS